MGPKEPRATVLTVEEEAIIVAFRRHTLLPLDDCLYGLQPTIPHLTRSSLHRCLDRPGISRLPDADTEAVFLIARAREGERVCLLEVQQGVDRYNVRDTVKAAAALRSVPIGPQLATILANWRARSAAESGLVFPSETGTPIGYPNIVNRQLGPLQVALGLVAADGSPRWTAHSFRHFAVSLWIDEGAKIEQVSEWAGHESPEFTHRVYGHRFAAGRVDRRAVAAGELAVLGAIEPATPTRHGNDNALKNGASASA
jgi:integrase